ncbi:MAG: hypothetical protein ORN98_09340 [Alphaproteobacteria bacterium]|nr:hypothetical protein [Alphaproteobacteria bacterium]
MPSDQPENGYGKLRVRVMVAIALLPWIIVRFLPPFNHDAAAIISFSDRIYDGARFGLDVTDVNPPMMFWWELVSVSLSRMTALPLWQAANLWLLAVMAGVLAFCFALTQRIIKENIDLRPILICYWPSLLYVLLLFPAHSFHQREHVILFLIQPYLLLGFWRCHKDILPRVQSVRNYWHISLSIVLLALAICIKPQYLLLFLLCEALIIFRLGIYLYLRQSYFWLMCFCGAVYLGAIEIFAPDFYLNIVPLEFGHYAMAARQGFVDMIIGREVPMVLGVLLASLLVILPPFFGKNRLQPSLNPSQSSSEFTKPDQRLTFLAFYVMGVTASLLAAMLQGKGWDYQFLVAHGLAIQLLALLVGYIWAGKGRIPPTAPQHNLSRQAIFFLVLLVLGGDLHPPFFLQRNYHKSTASRMENIVQNILTSPENATPHNNRIMVLSDSIYPYHPVILYTQQKFVLPELSLWLLSSLYNDNNHFNPPDQMDQAEKNLFNQTAAMMDKEKPYILIVDHGEVPVSGPDNNLDYLAYFKRHELFAKNLAQYQEVTRKDGFIYYVRQR